MTVFEKIFLCLVLLSTGAESERITKKISRPYENYNPPPFSYFNEFDEGQGAVQVQALTNAPPQSSQQQQQQPKQLQQRQEQQQQEQQHQEQQSQQQQLMWNQWAPAPPSHTNSQQTLPPLYRQLPQAAKRIRTTTPPSMRTPMNRIRKKFGRELVDTSDSTLARSRVLVSQREKVIANISANLQPYFMRAVVHDYLTRLKNTTRIMNVLLATNELAALENQCVACSVPELQSLLTILLTIMEKYPALNEDDSLAGHVATEYERAADYLNRKMEQLRTEMAAIRYDSDFREIQKRYARRERKGGIMSLLLDWFETFVRDGRVNPEDIQQKLMKHLATQKRYWLISVRGVL